MRIIPTAEHPHNLDPTAAIVWENRATLDAVYRVRASFVATIGRVGSYDVTFATQAEAVAAVDRFRSRVLVEAMYSAEG